ncbi:hypothetical protein FA13DRAFT_1509217 [Coprinellus micaceus]|uniref:Uncharacterized protein n=1 Tax=Coprinellus micaceus TaxID=71717 RepID=A0A4Y7SKU2_COPMI|nr:hypothetical protein FA13DRAFT_1509217 [Coprinellus micaceus]
MSTDVYTLGTSTNSIASAEQPVVRPGIVLQIPVSRATLASAKPYSRCFRNRLYLSRWHVDLSSAWYNQQNILEDSRKASAPTHLNNEMATELRTGPSHQSTLPSEADTTWGDLHVDTGCCECCDAARVPGTW